MNKLVAEMLIVGDSVNVRNIINGYIRDGAIAGSGIEYRFCMRELPTLGDETRCVWCVGQSAILAERQAEDRTLLKLLAVKGIVHNDGEAGADWGVLQSEFDQRNLLKWEKSIIGLDTAIDLTILERDLIRGLLPQLPDEKAFKEARHIHYRGDRVDVLIQQDWEDMIERHSEIRAHFEEIQRLEDYSVEEATALYYAELDTGGSDQSQSPAACKRQGGRPRLPENEWAYEEVRTKGRQPQDVYPEWLNRIGNRKERLDNPRDSFNKAIKERPGKKQETTE